MKRCVGALFLALCVAFAESYTDATLPSTIMLYGGQRQDTVTSTKSPQGWQITTIGLNRNPHLSIQGTAGSQYALIVQDTTTTFYSSGFSVGSGISATLMGTHTLAIQSGSININSGATFSVISSGTTINAQGSEYGGESKVRFAKGSSLILGTNAKANFSNVKFFIHSGSTTISQGANLTISAPTIRLQNTFQNNGGSVNLTGNVYNVGYPSSILNNSTSTFSLDGGSVSVSGNFYNGIESKDISVDNSGSGAIFNVYDNAFGGGGNLVIKDASMSISGSLISQRGGDSINGGGISNPQNSSISILGGTLKVSGGVENLTGSTLTFGAYNGVMGKIDGNLTNSGSVVVDLAGMSASESVTLITGAVSGVDSSNMTIKNGNSDFASASLSSDFKSVNFTINSGKITDFKANLNANERATLGAFGDSIYTISGANGAKLKASANSINRAIFSTFYATPLAIIDTLNADISSAQKRKARRKTATQRTKTRKNASLKAQNATNPNDINAGLILKGISTNDTNGILSGVKAGYGSDFANARFALNLAYAYGSINGATNGDIATFATSTKSHNFMLHSNLNARIVGDFGFDLGISGAVAIADSVRKLESSALNVSLKSKQNIYQIAQDLAFLYDFKISNFTIMPYLGISQGYIVMPKFSESGSGEFILSAEGLSAYFLDALFGAKMGFDFGNYGSILTDLEYKFLAFRSQKWRILRYTQNTEALRFDIPNAHKISLNVGYHKDFNRWYLRIDGSFGTLMNTSKENDTKLNFYSYGISAKFGWRF